ncbi:hypothetical protein BT96DRAFT_915392 [Gymnopus androsaceus JB14]|uniref:Uncharacterized protein n=1 Tax=Gymnopus androsaceus JB14 TaxID=1447944 RepID=A0A6A4I8X3_9AGAR|nr:hypothetical protein BT96DRAFT_915392 [Gymnopus androsaceus JB14]
MLPACVCVYPVQVYLRRSRLAVLFNTASPSLAFNSSLPSSTKDIFYSPLSKYIEHYNSRDCWNNETEDTLERNRLSFHLHFVKNHMYMALLDYMLTLLALHFLSKIFNLSRRSRLPLPPGPRKLPVLGNFFDMPQEKE